MGSEVLSEGLGSLPQHVCAGGAFLWIPAPCPWSLGPGDVARRKEKHGCWMAGGLGCDETRRSERSLVWPGWPPSSQELWPMPPFLSRMCVIHGCYLNRAGGALPPIIGASQGSLRVVDPSKGQACDSSETALSWNQVGQRGPAGPQGPAGPGISVFRSSGRFVAPPAASSVLVSPGAAGAAGVSALENSAGGGGGGQGGYVRALVPVMPASVYSVTVGAGGGRRVRIRPRVV